MMDHKMIVEVMVSYQVPGFEAEWDLILVSKLQLAFIQDF
jgi:hypothetical protein